MKLPNNTYPISCWTYFSLKDRYPNMVKDWKDLGINRPLTPSYIPERSSKPAMMALLDECYANGIFPILNDTRISGGAINELTKTRDLDGYRAKVREVVAEFGHHPAVSGFYVTDEPDAPDAWAAFQAARIQQEEAPWLRPYLNLLPWFDWIGERMGTDTLANYLDRCVSESGLSEIGYDCYTQQWPGDSGYDVYFENLREYLELSVRSGVEFNTTLLCINHYRYECHGINDYRWQISTAAAMGAKGLCWFYPDAHMGYHDNYRDAPINPFCERTSTFEWLSTENRIFTRQFGAEFLRLTVDKAYMTKQCYGGIPAFEGDKDLLAITDKTGEANFLVSFFHDAAGERYAAVVNLSRTENLGATMTFAEDVTPYLRGWNGYGALETKTDAVAQNESGAQTVGKKAYCHMAPGQLFLLQLKKA